MGWDVLECDWMGGDGLGWFDVQGRIGLGGRWAVIEVELTVGCDGGGEWMGCLGRNRLQRQGEKLGHRKAWTDIFNGHGWMTTHFIGSTILQGWCDDAT